MIKNTHAIILCGGKGERLRPLTDFTPKPLIKIDDKPILGHQINFLQKNGIDKITIATGYKSDLIEEFIFNNFKDLHIKTVNSGDVDILDRIKLSTISIDNEFLVCYGDTLADVKINELLDFHFYHGGDATITCYQLRSQFGILEINS